MVKNIYNLLMIWLLLSFMSAQPAWAHTALKSSNIEHGSVLSDAPDHLEIVFGSAVGLVGIVLKDGGDQAIDLAYEKPKSMQKSFSITLPTLEAGKYTFYWRTVAKDGHVMKGEIAFTVT
ncbi:MAG: copper resistance protein CopC [Robiginitomaculum sp.]|nr:MAG: copper resistance protein CopC [Robiginitomaculum sp.]